MNEQVRRTNKSLDKSSRERCREQEGSQVIRKAIWSEGLICLAICSEQAGIAIEIVERI